MAWRNRNREWDDQDDWTRDQSALMDTLQNDQQGAVGEVDLNAARESLSALGKPIPPPPMDDNAAREALSALGKPIPPMDDNAAREALAALGKPIAPELQLFPTNTRIGREFRRESAPGVYGNVESGYGDTIGKYKPRQYTSGEGDGSPIPLEPSLSQQFLPEPSLPIPLEPILPESLVALPSVFGPNRSRLLNRRR